MTASLHVAAPAAAGATPQRILLADAARRRIESVARSRDALARPPLHVAAAFSFKTNPRPELLELAREAGFCAETISADELRAADAAGFARRDAIYNGPAPLCGDALREEPVGIAFADSPEAFAHNLRSGVATVCGVRLRPSMIASRFGVSVDDEPDLHRLLASRGENVPTAVSFHARREDFKGTRWVDVADDVLARAVEMERATGCRVVAFDVGGGWTPEEFDDVFHEDMTWIAERVAGSLPACTRLIFEPGQAVCTPTEALLTRVTEVRRRGRRREVIVDAGYPDWPQMHEYRHAVFALRGERWSLLGAGPDRIGGRTCLEYDVIEGLRLPDDVAAGDCLAIADVGSYDHSMSFDFAHGR